MRAPSFWLGFGVWHVLDVVGFHWVLQMHRARIGVPDPLTYDLIFLVLGLVSLAVGWVVLRRPGGGAGTAVAAGLAAAVLVSAPGAALPPRDPDPAVQALLGGGTLPAFCAGWTRLAAAPPYPAR